MAQDGSLSFNHMTPKPQQAQPTFKTNSLQFTGLDNTQPKKPQDITATTKFTGDLRKETITPQSKPQENSWKKYYDDEFKKVSSKQNFAQRLFDGGNASRRAEINAKNRFNAEQIRKAWDNNGKVKDAGLANSLKNETANTSALARSNSDITRANLRQIGATADSQNERSRFNNTLNALRLMDFGSGVVGADDTSKFDGGDIARFLTNLAPQSVPMLNIAYGGVRGLANVRDAITGKGVDYTTGRDKSLSGLERLGRGGSGAMDVVAPAFGGSQTVASSIKNALLGTGKNIAKQAAQAGVKGAVKNFVKDALSEGVEESVQQVADYYGQGGRLTENGKLKAENVKDLASQTVQAGVLGAAGGALMHGAGMGISATKNAIDAKIKANVHANIDAKIDPKTNPVQNAVAKVQANNEIRLNRLSPNQMKYNAAEAVGAIKGDTRRRMSRAAFSDLQNARNSNPYTTGNGMDVELTRNGNRKMTRTSQKTPNEMFNVQQRLSPVIGEALAKSQQIDASQDSKNHGFAKDGFTYHEVPVKFAGKRYNTTFDVGTDGDKNIIYNATTRKSPMEPAGTNPSTELHHLGDSHDLNISQNNGDVNSVDASNLSSAGQKYEQYGNDFYDISNIQETPPQRQTLLKRGGVYDHNISQSDQDVKMKLGDENLDDLNDDYFDNETDNKTASSTPVDDVDDYIEQQIELQSKANKGIRKEKVKDTIAKLKHALIDDTTAYEAYMGKAKGKEAKAAKEALRSSLRNDIDNVRSSEMIAQQFIRDNGLSSIGKLSESDLGKFQQYLIARRHAADLHKQGIKTGRDLAMDIAIIAKYKKKFSTQEKAYRGFNKALLNYMEENGLISKAQHKAMSKNVAYAPFQRVMDDISSFTGNSQQLGNLSSESVIKGIKGSERVIKNPIESTMANTMRIINEGLRNTAARNISENVFAESRLRDGQKPRAGYDTINYLENGKKVSYEVPELVAKEMKRLNRTMPDGVDKIMKVLGAPTRALRTGATSANPMFAASNLMRDQLQTLITGKITTTFNPVGNAKAFAATFLPGKLGENLRAELARNGIIGSEYRQTYGYKPGDLMNEIQKENHLTRSAADKLRHPIDTLADIIGRTEYYTRAQQYFGTNGDVVAKSQAARNNTLNFSRGGSVVMTLNKIVPFLNAGIQGGRQITKQFTSRPVRTTLMFAAFGAVMAAVRGANERDEEKKELYKRITDSDKSTNIIVLGDDAKYNPETGRVDGVTKIAIPQFLYPLADGINNVEGKPEDFVRIAADIMQAFTGIDVQNPVNQLTPTAVKPFIEAGFNKNSFTGQDLVSEYDANKNPEDKGAKYTSGAARMLAKLTGVDAPIIDNFISNWGGGLAKDLVKTMTDNPNNAKDGGGLKKMLEDGAYRRFGSASAESQYKMSTDATDSLKDDLKKDGAFLKLAKSDQEKVLNALDNDGKSIGSLLSKLERGEDIKDKHFSDRQEGLLSGFNSGEYIDQVLNGSKKVDRKRMYSENDYEYKEFKKEYGKKVSKGEYSKAEELEATQKLKKLEVGKDFSKETRENYGLSKKQLRQLLEESDDPKQMLNDVLSYGDALVKAGLADRNKFRDKYGNINLSDKSSKKGRKSSRGSVSSWKIDTMALIRGALNNSGTGTGSAPKKYNLKSSAARRQNVAIKRLGTTVKFAQGLYKK